MLTTGTEFLLAKLSNPQYLELIGDKRPTMFGTRTALGDIRCPQCDMPFVAKVRDDVSDAVLESYVWHAAAHLASECPDHPSRFVVGGGGIVSSDGWSLWPEVP